MSQVDTLAVYRLLGLHLHQPHSPPIDPVEFLPESLPNVRAVHQRVLLLRNRLQHLQHSLVANLVANLV